MHALFDLVRNSDLREAIESPLYYNGREAVDAGIKEWLQQVMPVIDRYTNKDQYRDVIQQIPEDDYDTHGNLRDKQYDKEHDLLVRNNKLKIHDDLVKSFKAMLEKQLREATIAYIEGEFGKVERIVPKESFDEMRKRHLYFMQFVIVDIEYTATHKKSGKPMSGGGYFQKHPSQSEFTDEWSGENIDWGNELGFAIKVYTSRKALIEAAVDIIIEELQIEHFGERLEPNGRLNALLDDLLGTWVHEVVHLEQTTRRHILDRTFYKYDMGMSYTPQEKSRTKHDVWKDQGSRTVRTKVRGGKRGFPSHLSGGFEDIDASEWIEYFGTAHEIEAHAAGAAAQIVHSFVADLSKQGYYGSGDYRQREINISIDDMIQDIASGYMPYGIKSLDSYKEYIRDSAMHLYRFKAWRDRDIARDSRALDKINTGARKVWKIFLTKLVKHLRSYKKPVQSWDDERDPRFKLPAPAQKPQLPA